VVTVTITLGWLIVLVVLLFVRNMLHTDVRWWLATSICGVLMGVFGLYYVPLLKRRRERITADRAAATTAAESPSPEPGTQLSSEYVSRDNGSNTVSSTETPGKSTRS
jgi:hypothetical protein